MNETWWERWKPLVLKLLALLLASVGGAAASQQLRDPQIVEKPIAVPVTIQLPPVVAPSEAALSVEGRWRRDGRSLFVGQSREKLVDTLTREGFASVGGPRTPLTERRAKELVDRLTDETVAEAGKSVGAPLEVERGGPILDRLKQLGQWIKEHPEEVAAFIKLLLTILLAFL